MAAFLERDDTGAVKDVEMSEQLFDDDIFKLVEYIRQKHQSLYDKDLDPNLIFSCLEENKDQPDRAEFAMIILFPDTSQRPQQRTVNNDGDWDMENAMGDDVPNMAEPRGDRDFHFANSHNRVIPRERELGLARAISIIDLELMDDTSEPSGATSVVPLIDLEPEIDSQFVTDRMLIRLLEFFPEADVNYLKLIVSRIIFKNVEDLNNEVYKWLLDCNYPKRIKEGYCEPDIRPSTSQGLRSPARNEEFSRSHAKLNEIIDYMKDRVNEHEKRGEASNSFPTLQNDHARLQNDYMTCLCCFEDNVQFDESEFCREGNHPFCRTCVRKFAEGVAAGNVAVLKCMAPDCPSTFSQETAKRVLKPIVYEQWTQRCQLNEVIMADLPNFRTCPHCNFGIVIDNPNEKLFRCMKPGCEKVTCLLCQRENHIPLRCHEVEKPNDIELRTSEEERKTNAVIFSCPKCHLRIIKKYGCNMVTCCCGQSICHVCRRAIKNYKHFQKGCPVETPRSGFNAGKRIKQQPTRQNADAEANADADADADANADADADADSDADADADSDFDADSDTSDDEMSGEDDNNEQIPGYEDDNDNHGDEDDNDNHGDDEDEVHVDEDDEDDNGYLSDLARYAAGMRRQVDFVFD